MQKTISPIKRSKQLAGVSREHHETLLFVWKIKQGVAYEIAPERIAAYCEWYWNNHLREHFHREEVALSKILPPSHVLMNNMIEDHEAIKIKMEQVIDDPSYHLLKRLAQIIYYHIRFEERTLFIHIENAATTEGLEEAAVLLTCAKNIKQLWNDEFWIKKQTRFSTN
jgi:hypothetical protein